jgi:hypothetical protein
MSLHPRCRTKMCLPLFATQPITTAGASGRTANAGNVAPAAEISGRATRLLALDDGFGAGDTNVGRGAWFALGRVDCTCSKVAVQLCTSKGSGEDGEHGREKEGAEGKGAHRNER